MSNTNTDQRLTSAQMSPITNPTAATIVYGQVNTTGQNNGATAGNVQLRRNCRYNPYAARRDKLHEPSNRNLLLQYYH